MTPSASIPRGSGIVHAALALGGFAIGTTEFATMSILPLFARDLHVDLPTGGRAISAYAIGVVVGAPLLAVGGARQSRRTMLIMLMGWVAIANLLSAAAPSFGWLLLFRFLSGLPHGAYFGLAALVAASLVEDDRRAMAVGRVMAGLTVATVVGVPAANLLAQLGGWRVSFVVVAALAVATVAAMWALVPRDRGRPDAAFLAELEALRSGQVWLTLGIGAIGFGGMFAIYTYLVPTLTEVTRAPALAVPFVLALFGVGTTLGNLLVPRLASRTPMPAAGALLLWAAVAAAIYPFAAQRLWSIAAIVVAIGLGGALGTLLQTRLMDVAGRAQVLAAALNHSAFNTANALGPWLGGLAISAGAGWASTGWVASGLALGGLAIWALALATDRRGAPPLVQQHDLQQA
ncbi:MFS transporter [uncultured Sphingomonas sp.]|uniref:MFS transporter n=1 Tax=uncultured Sphingomonas sp. TaxID=158754 RepID=UPI0035CC33A6